MTNLDVEELIGTFQIYECSGITSLCLHTKAESDSKDVIPIIL